MKPQTSDQKPVEERIIEAARSVFIEKGYSETSMGDIAEAAGINRPALHYYFRTKDKMFDAVYGGILKALLPKIQVITSSSSLSMDERVGLLIDAYNEVFLKYPTLPLFLIRELHRNVDFMIETMERAGFMDVLWQIRDVIQAMIDSGHVEKVPIRFLLFNFYSLLCVPYLSKNLSKKLLDEDEDGFRKMLTEWKPVIISQMHSFALGQGKTA